jgi:hypothetical protein
MNQFDQQGRDFTKATKAHFSFLKGLALHFVLLCQGGVPIETHLGAPRELENAMFKRGSTS